MASFSTFSMKKQIKAGTENSKKNSNSLKIYTQNNNALMINAKLYLFKCMNCGYGELFFNI